MGLTYTFGYGLVYRIGVSWGEVEGGRRPPQGRFHEGGRSVVVAVCLVVCRGSRGGGGGLSSHKVAGGFESVAMFWKH